MCALMVSHIMEEERDYTADSKVPSSLCVRVCVCVCVCVWVGGCAPLRLYFFFPPPPL